MDSQYILGWFTYFKYSNRGPHLVRYSSEVFRSRGIQSEVLDRHRPYLGLNSECPYLRHIPRDCTLDIVADSLTHLRHWLLLPLSPRKEGWGWPWAGHYQV